MKKNTQTNIQMDSSTNRTREEMITGFRTIQTTTLIRKSHTKTISHSIISSRNNSLQSTLYHHCSPMTSSTVSFLPCLTFTCKGSLIQET